MHLLSSSYEVDSTDSYEPEPDTEKEFPCCMVISIGGGRTHHALEALAVANRPPTILLLWSCSPDDVDSLLMLEAEGFLSGDHLDEKELAQAVRSVAAGMSYVSPQLANHVLRKARNTRSPHLDNVYLTQRETVVLRLVADGMTNKQIARSLSISVHGVKQHVSSLLAKLQSPNRTLAVARALADGLVEI